MFEKRIKKRCDAEGTIDAWRYVVLLGLILILVIGLLQITPFGIIYGSLLADIGNEVQDTSTVNSVFTMMFLGAGLPINQLLQKMSYRKVAFIGAIIFNIGALSSPFVTSAFQLVITFGVLQGLGWGIMIASALLIFTEYFKERQNFFMSIAHFVSSTITVSFPVLSMLSVHYYGKRGTILLTAALSLHLIFVALCFQPLKWHVKYQVPLLTEENNVKAKRVTVVETKKDLESEEDKYNIHFEKNDSTFWSWCKTLCKSFDLVLFKDPVFVNLAIGVSMAQSSDIMYISFLPLVLSNAGFLDENVSILMTIYVASDLAGKLLLCFVTAFIKIKNRYLLLMGATGMAIFRLSHTLNYSFGWTASMCCCLGLVRACVENTNSLVFAEMFPKRLVTSYSLFMIVNALVVVILGQIIRTLTSITNNKEIILYVLAVSAACCVVPWTIELTYIHIKNKFLTT